MKVRELLEAFDRDEAELLAHMLRKLPGTKVDVERCEVRCRLDPQLPDIYGFVIDLSQGRGCRAFMKRPDEKLMVHWYGNHDEETGVIPMIKEWVVKDAEQAFDSIRAILNKARAKQ